MEGFTGQLISVAVSDFWMSFQPIQLCINLLFYKLKFPFFLFFFALFLFFSLSLFLSFSPSSPPLLPSPPFSTSPLPFPPLLFPLLSPPFLSCNQSPPGPCNQSSLIRYAGNTDTREKDISKTRFYSFAICSKASGPLSWEKEWLGYWKLCAVTAEL